MQFSNHDAALVPAALFG